MIAISLLAFGFVNMTPQELAAYESGVTQAKLACVLLDDAAPLPDPDTPTPDRPNPDTPQPGDACENCHGTGRVGDANSIVVDCVVCDGDGRIDESDVASERANAVREAKLLRRIETLEAWQAKQIAWSKAMVAWSNKNRCNCGTQADDMVTQPLFVAPLRFEPQAIQPQANQPRCVNGQCRQPAWRW